MSNDLEYKAIRTPYTIADLLHYAPAELKGAGRVLFVAHQLTESSSACLNHNTGNVRPRTGEPFTRYACGEELPIAKARALAKEDPEHVAIVKIYDTNEGQKASVNFKAPHPYTRFRSFDNLGQASERFAEFLQRYSERWIALRAGDVVRYNNALLASRYYTADGERYLRCLKGCMARVERDRSMRTVGAIVPELLAKETPAIPSDLHPIAEADLIDPVERARVAGLVSLTIAEYLRNET